MADEDRVKWDSRYRERDGPGTPSAFLRSLAESLPHEGRALDLAGGSGRHALWLAQRGLSVTLADISEVALALARRAAEAAGLALRTVSLDLEREPLPAGPWDLIVDSYYLQRGLFAVFPRVLAPGGLLVFCQPTRADTARNAHVSPRFCLEDGELPSLVQGLEVVSYEERWWGSGRHEARLVARKGSRGALPHPELV